MKKIILITFLTICFAKAQSIRTFNFVADTDDASINGEVFNDFDLSSYIGLLRASVLASGLIFELPIIIYFLTKIGIVTPKFLSKNRKFALIIVLSLSAIITPPDIVSQIIVSIPLLILYEVSIFISKFTYRRLEKQMQNDT